MSEIPTENGNGHDAQMQETVAVNGMYETWFLDYASYVILDRAVPYIEDGLKPVQRRILHAMKEMDDGRYNKVANIIGQTMQYHPHGDAAIGDAIVNLGQKDLLIDTQGNWGNIYTGDGAAAPRYIEARLSKFALEVAFNKQTTLWQMSYDGRKEEPLTLPVKFPLVLAQGVEGIAVGLSTKIMPHNFLELCEASIAHLKGRSFKLYPDFPTGGMIDVENYNWGERGGKIRVRAKVEELDKHTLVITELPYGVTTQTLIDSILKANDKGKIKIRKIEDNTARNVEILVHLAKGISPAIAIDALYAFTACEQPISPNCCIIIDEKPVFTDVRSMLRLSTEKTKELLRQELEIRKSELEDKWHMSSLEKIFIENRIYRDIEEEETWEGVISAIDRGLDPFKHLLFREVTTEDILRLTEIKIKRISKFDSFKADEAIKKIEEELAEVKHHLAHLVEYTISWFEHLITKFGKGRERMTQIMTFDTIDRTQVAVNNVKLYMDAEGGFIGTGLKKEQFVTDCSDIDDIVVFRSDGAVKVVKVDDKIFVGKGIIYAGVFNKNDDRMVYHMIYTDAKDKRTYVKRFNIGGITRDREYFLTKCKGPSKVLYFTAMPNGESEIVNVRLRGGANTKLRKTDFDYDLAELDIKGRGAGGNLLTKHPVLKVTQKSVGASTLGGRDIWFDDSIQRLNTDGIGQYLGNFEGDDKILVLYAEGAYELTSQDLTNRYQGKGKILEITKLRKDTVVTAIHYAPGSDRYLVKRFQIETTTVDQKFSFIAEEEGAKLLYATAMQKPVVTVHLTSRNKDDFEVDLESFIEVKGWKAQGNKLTDDKVRKVEPVSFFNPNVKKAKAAKSEEEEEEDAEMEDVVEGEEEVDEDGVKQNPADIPMEIEKPGSPTLFD